MDEGSFRTFIDTEYPTIVGTVSAICGSRASAEDAVQEALARAWERSERGEPIASLGAWVTTVALNISRNRLRHLAVEWRARRRMAGEVSSGAASPSGDRVDIIRALRTLPRRQREAIVLHYYLGYDVVEVADAMKAPVGTVKSLLSRARSRLETPLGELDPNRQGA